MALGPGLTFKAFLRGRQPTTRLKQEYAALVKSRTPQPTMPPSGRTPADTPPVRSSGSRPSVVGSGTRTNGSRIRTNPRFDTKGVQVDPSRIRTESYTPPAPNTVPRMAANNPMRTINGAMPQSPTPPSGGGERLVKEKTFAQRAAPVVDRMKARALASKPGMVKPDTSFGRGLKGGIVGAVAGHMIDDVTKAGSALMSGDFKTAAQRGLDTIQHTPLGFGLSAGDAASFAATGKAMRDKPSGLLDRIAHGKYLPDRAYERDVKPPVAGKKEDNPAFKKPEGVGKPIGAAPRQPDSLRGIGEQARGQSKALRSPDDYLGSAFDATLRKGIDTGRNYLRSQMNKDGLDSDQQSKIMARFNDKIAGDKELSKAANKGGIVNTIEAKDPGRGQRTLEAYRGQRGAYKGNTSYKDMQEKYVK